MAASYTRVGWQNQQAGGTKLGATNLGTMDDGIGDLYELPNAKGDLLVAIAADTLERLGVGSNDQVLVADSAQTEGMKWAAVPGLSAYIPLATVTAKGDLIAASASGTVDNLPVGTNGQVLTAASGETLGMEWATITGGATVATTVAGLGTGSDGDLGLLRLGTTPYAFVPLTFDNTYGEWISPQFTLGSVGYFDETSTALVERGGYAIPDFKAHTDAGLTLMARFFSIGNRPGGAGTSTTVQLLIDEWDGSDTSITAVDSLTEHVHSSAANTYILGDWEAVSAPASLAHGMARIAAKTSTGTGTIVAAHAVGRWEASD